MAQEEDVGEVLEARQGELARGAPRSQDEFRVGEGLAGLGLDGFGGEIDRGGGLVVEIYRAVVVPFFGLQVQLGGVGDESFGQLRSVDWQAFAGDDGDMTRVAKLAEFEQGSECA